MSNFTINAPSTTPQNLDDGDIGYIGISGSLDTTAAAVTATVGATVSLLVDGRITASESSAVDWRGIASGQVIVGKTGIVDGQTGVGVFARFDGSLNIQNDGRIVADIVGIFAEAGLRDANLTILNNGTIEARNGTAVLAIVSEGPVIIRNTGSILSSTVDMSPNIAIQGFGNDNASGTIINTGTIGASGGAAIFAIGASLVLRNAGTVTGDILVQDAGAPLSGNITNSGIITGDVVLSDYNDRFDGRGGTLNGSVFGGRGNDIYVIDRPTAIVETLGGGIDTAYTNAAQTELVAFVENLSLIGAAISGSGNDLANTISGNRRANLLQGLDGNDTLTGGAGADTVVGGTGNDWIRGDAGRDALQGDAGNDALFAGIGNDILMGGTGNDILWGGSERDTLNGGLGQDLLFGGAGDDSFVFNETADSPVAAFDTIADFVRSADKIILSGFGNVTFIGTAAFTAVGQVRIVDLGSDVTVEVNTIGAAGADMEILVSGVGTLTASDFIL